MTGACRGSRLSHPVERRRSQVWGRSAAPERAAWTPQGPLCRGRDLRPRTVAQPGSEPVGVPCARQVDRDSEAHQRWSCRGGLGRQPATQKAYRLFLPHFGGASPSPRPWAPETPPEARPAGCRPREPRAPSPTSPGLLGHILSDSSGCHAGRRRWDGRPPAPGALPALYPGPAQGPERPRSGRRASGRVGAGPVCGWEARRADSGVPQAQRPALPGTVWKRDHAPTCRPSGAHGPAGHGVPAAGPSPAGPLCLLKRGGMGPSPQRPPDKAPHLRGRNSQSPPTVSLSRCGGEGPAPRGTVGCPCPPGGAQCCGEGTRLCGLRKLLQVVPGHWLDVLLRTSSLWGR